MKTWAVYLPFQFLLLFWFAPIDPASLPASDPTWQDEAKCIFIEMINNKHRSSSRNAPRSLSWSWPVTSWSVWWIWSCGSRSWAGATPAKLMKHWTRPPVLSSSPACPCCTAAATATPRMSTLSASTSSTASRSGGTGMASLTFPPPIQPAELLSLFLFLFHGAVGIWDFTPPALAFRLLVFFKYRNIGTLAQPPPPIQTNDCITCINETAQNYIIFSNVNAKDPAKIFEIDSNKKLPRDTQMSLFPNFCISHFHSDSCLFMHGAYVIALCAMKDPVCHEL